MILDELNIWDSVISDPSGLFAYENNGEKTTLVLNLNLKL